MSPNTELCELGFPWFTLVVLTFLIGSINGFLYSWNCSVLSYKDKWLLSEKLNYFSCAVYSSGGQCYFLHLDGVDEGQGSSINFHICDPREVKFI